MGRCFDIGVTTRMALQQFERCGFPLMGQMSPRSAGNGSLMRGAPVPLAYHRDPARAVELSGTTHALPVLL